MTESGDCNDEDEAVGGPLTCYADADRDGYPSASSVLCEPTETFAVLAGDLISTTHDSCDGDPDTRRKYLFYRDTDGDGAAYCYMKEYKPFWQSSYTAPYCPTYAVCATSANVAPTGYTTSSDKKDYCDSNASHTKKFYYYDDGDGDGVKQRHTALRVSVRVLCIRSGRRVSIQRESHLSTALLPR